MRNLSSEAGSVMLTISFLLLAWILYKLYYMLWDHYYFRNYPTALLHPIFGTMGKFWPREEGMYRFSQLIRKYPQHKFWRNRMGPFFNMIVIVHPEAIGQILRLNASEAPKGNAYNIIQAYLGDGLLVAKNPKWFTRRKMLTSAFHFDIINGYIEIFNDSISTVMAYWDKLLLDNSSSIDINVFQCMSRLTLDVMLRCACSYELASPIGKLGDDSKYITSIKTANSLLVQQMTRLLYLIRPLFHMTRAGFQWRKVCNDIRQQSLKVIKARRQAIFEDDSLLSKNRKKDFIDILLTATDSNGKHLTDQDIIDEMNTFLFEGHDTTASGLAWTLYMLGIHSDYQNQCRDEIRQLLSGRDSEAIQYNDVTELKFTTMCIKETLRLYPPVTGVGRKLTRSIYIDEHFIPKGTEVTLSIGQTHRNPAVWENADLFNPHRFEASIPGGHIYAYVPFSAGVRNCIGQKFAISELVITTARILNRFSIESLSTDVKRLSLVTLKAEEDIILRLKSINGTCT